MTKSGSLSSAAAPVDRYASGEIIAGRYELVRRLGVGGMGVVWVARSQALGVEVALKLLHGAADEIAVERMAREARAAARLGHSSIVRVFDFGKTDAGQPFIAMELLEGEDLYRTLKQGGRKSAVDAVALILPIVDGLVVAHGHGIVHRDLKPENLFIARDKLGRPEPKILDFGIAKLDAVDDTRLTQIGAVLGSPAYLSPEQAAGDEDVDHRADIWSLGVVLYELVTGGVPFDGKNSNAMLRSITLDQPRATTDLAAGNEALWKIIRKCLRKRPADRFASMHELGEALARWLLREGVELDVTSRSVRETWLSPGASRRRLESAVVQSVGAPEIEHDTATLDGKGEGRTTRIRARARIRWSRWVIGGAACAIAVAAFWFMRLRAPERLPRVVEQAEPTVAARPAPPAVTAEVVVKSPSSVASAAPDSTDRAGPAVPRREVAGKNRLPTVSKTPKPATKPAKVDAEFGF